jgi:hypothetical protein
MKWTNFTLLIAALLLAFSCCPRNNNSSKIKKMAFIDNQTLKTALDSTKARYPKANTDDISSGIKQMAKFWKDADGTKSDFVRFCIDNYQPTDSAKDEAMNKISRNLEILYGYLNTINLDLKMPLHMNFGEITSIDQMFGGYDLAGHLNEDFFKNKINFYILLNYKYFTLSEKTALAGTWNRLQWAKMRLAQIADSRVPGDIILNYSDVNSKTESYISEYNIYMGNLVNDKQEKLFPKGMKLISHWGLRDELKADYNADRGLEKQKMIYHVMQHIINQDIPEEVINSPKYDWNPLSNKLFDNQKEISFKPEPDTRYEWLLNNFKALKEMDAYDPFYPTYIQAKFDKEMEIPQPDVEKLFTDLVSSPQVRKVASLIEKRLNRRLEPFDIWYDGFKSRGSIDVAKLDQKIKKKYPNSEAFQKDVPNILIKLGFQPDKAAYIASKIQVDAARGSGHAWGAQMKGDKAHLRTRIAPDGMDYKGFNIAMHELGHCVEETITLYDIDYYLLNGVPNTAFTEALAFVFQKRDLDILGIKDNQPNKYDLMALDIFWSNYEIMGVSLVDMNVWKWLYQHPDANKQQLKEAVIRISKEVWNKYYADVFGVKDQPILAIYSHMIDYPLYLSAYPIGYLIDFQIEKQLKGKNFGDEIIRIYSKGRILPQQWMKEAVGAELSDKPLLEAVDLALGNVK